MKKEEASISLFDHLGRAAGTKLGEEVYQAAKKAKEPVNTRYVATKYYKGEVMLYREEFLKEYFNGKRINRG
jgi:hypothetical protein